MNDDGPRISDDGRFWWDGTMWVPVGQQSLRRGAGRAVSLGVVLLMLFVLVIALAALVFG